MGNKSTNCGAKTRLLAALSFLLILSSLISSTQSARCCVRYRQQPLRCGRLTDYTLQTINNSCDIAAVIFHTRGGFVCTDPSKDWVLRTIRCVDEKKRKAESHSAPVAAQSQ